MLREYGEEKLELSREMNATRAHHSYYFSELMRQYETSRQQPQQLETMLAIEQDFENFRLAWEWALENQQAAHLHAMLNALPFRFSVQLLP